METGENTTWRWEIKVMCVKEHQRLLANHQSQEEVRKASPRGFKDSMTLSTPWFWISIVQNYETIKFYCFKPSSCWYLAMAALGGNLKCLLILSLLLLFLFFLLLLKKHSVLFQKPNYTLLPRLPLSLVKTIIPWNLNSYSISCVLNIDSSL